VNTDSQSPPFTAERQRRIADLLREQGRVEVLELARLLQVSEHTVRRDLLVLQGQGLLQRTHGGAVTLDTQRLGLGARAAVLADAKAAVGRAAAALVEAGQTVVLDAGSTPLAMARALTVRPLTVITSSLDVAAIFAGDPQVQIALTGGTWQHDNRALWGPAAIAMLANCRADWAVPGACAIDAQLGVSAPDEADAALKRAMIACARRTLILGDHSKLGNTAPFHVAPWSRVHALLIDEPWAEGAAAGVPLRVAGEHPAEAHDRAAIRRQDVTGSS
jgi:DeoR/GlpR family transcriptional regulator of sugar metabolism